MSLFLSGLENLAYSCSPTASRFDTITRIAMPCADFFSFRLVNVFAALIPSMVAFLGFLNLGAALGVGLPFGVPHGLQHFPKVENGP